MLDLNLSSLILPAAIFVWGYFVGWFHARHGRGKALVAGLIGLGVLVALLALPPR